MFLAALHPQFQLLAFLIFLKVLSGIILLLIAMQFKSLFGKFTENCATYLDIVLLQIWPPI